MRQPIITDLKFLRQPSKEVEEERAFALFSILEESLDIKKGIGLSAIQIGLPLRVGIIRLPNCKLDLWNPKIIEKNRRVRFAKEGCLSLPGIYVDTARYREIILENGDGKKYSLEDIEAIAVQHEVAHMNGKLILDYKWRKRR